MAGLTALLGAVAVLVGQVAKLRQDINGRLEQLLHAEIARAHKQGELEGRDYMSAKHERLADTSISSDVP